HSEHYFHSSFNDLVITGLVGLVPRDDDQLQLKPLAPADWPYFALTHVPYKGRDLAITWDRDGTRYNAGKGLRVFADGKQIAAADSLDPLLIKLPEASKPATTALPPVNFAVNNDGTYYPRLTASYSHPNTPPGKLIDGNYWYHRDPPNRWTCEGSPSASDSVIVDFGMKRPLHTVALYFLDDGAGIVPPARYDLEHWDGTRWQAIPEQKRAPETPTGRRANRVRFAPLETAKLRLTLHHAEGGKAGLTEFEAWGDSDRPVSQAPPPAGNLAYNPGNKPFPKATASHSDRFGGVPPSAIDGKTNFLPTPTNRWTSYESPNDRDWLEIDLGEEKTFSRIEVGIYDDRGGVQPPKSYEIETWNGSAWQAIPEQKRAPEKPVGGQFNEVRFAPVTARKVRVVFTHAGKARSGVTEIMIWKE
ncbi:MAG: discoidin domain-containing protein, partial [Gemmataceae bacterium]